MKLMDFVISADHSIVDRYKGGFVQRFRYESLSVSIPYSLYCEPRIETDDVRRVCFVFTDVGDPIQTWKDPLPTSHLEWTFDFSSYMSSQSDEDKKRQICAALHSASLEVAKRLSWPFISLQNANARLESDNFHFSGISKKTWISPDKKHKVAIAYEFGLLKLRLTAVLYTVRKPTEIARVDLGEFLHSLEWVWAYFKRGQWLSLTSFELEVGDFMTKKIVANFDL